MPDKYLILGNGRLANHMAHYMTYLNLNFDRWSRKENNLDDLNIKAKTCTHILILLKDSVISEFSTLPIFNKKTLIHFSGSLEINGCYSTHPLMTFTNTLYDFDTYKEIPFILTKNSPNFNVLLPGFPNQEYRIAGEQKNLYHALCVCGGNFSTLLWQMVFKDSIEKLDLPHQAFVPYMKGIINNLTTNPQDALTGPFVRNDTETIKTNQKALEQSDLGEIYNCFKSVYFK